MVATWTSSQGGGWTGAHRWELDGATTLVHLRARGQGPRSLQEPWIDTTTPIGEATSHSTIAWVGLEKQTLSEGARVTWSGTRGGRAAGPAPPATVGL